MMKRKIQKKRKILRMPKMSIRKIRRNQRRPLEFSRRVGKIVCTMRTMRKLNKRTLMSEKGRRVTRLEWRRKTTKMVMMERRKRILLPVEVEMAVIRTISQALITPPALVEVMTKHPMILPVLITKKTKLVMLMIAIAKESVQMLLKLLPIHLKCKAM